MCFSFTSLNFEMTPFFFFLFAVYAFFFFISTSLCFSETQTAVRTFLPNELQPRLLNETHGDSNDVLLFVCRITRAHAGSADMAGEDEGVHFPVLIRLCHSLTPSPPPAHSLFARFPLTFFWGRWVIVFSNK